VSPAGRTTASKRPVALRHPLQADARTAPTPSPPSTSTRCSAASGTSPARATCACPQSSSGQVRVLPGEGPAWLDGAELDAKVSLRSDNVQSMLSRATMFVFGAAVRSERHHRQPAEGRGQRPRRRHRRWRGSAVAW